MAMRTLEKIILTGTALITLAGSLIACNKKDYPVTPTEPPAIHNPLPADNVSDNITVEPIPISPTSPPVVAPKPVETP